MSEPHARTTGVAFTLGYLGAYYAVLWLGRAIWPDTVAASMDVLGAYAARLLIALLGAPAVGALLGTLATGVAVFSYTAMGSHRLSAARVFATGWLCLCVTNAMAVSIGMQLLVDETVGRAWLQQIGKADFNRWVLILAPTLGYLGGVLASVLGRRLVEAQNQ